MTSGVPGLVPEPWEPWALGSGPRRSFSVWGLAIPSHPHPMACSIALSGESMRGGTEVHVHIRLPNTPCIHPDRQLNLVCSYPTRHLGKKLTIRLPRQPGSRAAARCKMSDQPPCPPQQPTARYFPPKMFPVMQNFHRSSKHGSSCTRAHLQLASPSQLPEMPVAWFQICFRCGQDGPRTVPCPPQLFFMSLPTASVIATVQSATGKIYWLAFHA